MSRKHLSLYRRTLVVFIVSEVTKGRVVQHETRDIRWQNSLIKQANHSMRKTLGLLSRIDGPQALDEKPSKTVEF
jgi:hypothetical protein